jgi:hypothetical protein
MRRSLSPTLINPTPIPTMKKAVVILYLIAAVQTFLIIGAFKFGADSMRAAFRYSKESILEICDQRYVQK